jgi:hypothetical protein
MGSLKKFNRAHLILYFFTVTKFLLDVQVSNFFTNSRSSLTPDMAIEKIQ